MSDATLPTDVPPEKPAPADAPAPPSPPLRRKWPFRLVAAGASVVAALLLAEIVLRLFAEVTDVPVYALCAGVRRLLVPGQAGLFARDGADPIRARYSVNAAGFNDPREYAAKPGVRFVAVVGDSFVEALQVAQDESLVAVADRHASAVTPTFVAGFGASGLGTVDELELLRNVVMPLKPQAVVLMFVDNDIIDNSDPAPPAGASSARWYHRSALVRWLAYQKGLHRLGKGDLAALQADVWRTDEPEHIRRGWAATAEAMTDIRDLCAKRGVPLVVMHVPPYQAMSYCDEVADARSDFRQVGRRLALICRDRDIRCVDLLDDLDADHRATGRTHYFRGDGHWNAAGHEVAGRRIAAELGR